MAKGLMKEGKAGIGSYMPLPADVDDVNSQSWCGANAVDVNSVNTI